MAMGASYCLGIRCPRNFRAPFLAEDIIDFWSCWHITLSTWFRDFVFMRFKRFAVHCKLIRGGRLRVLSWALTQTLVFLGFAIFSGPVGMLLGWD